MDDRINRTDAFLVDNDMKDKPGGRAMSKQQNVTGEEMVVDKTYIYDKIIEWISPLGCYYDPDALKQFILEMTSQKEYRLTGRYGFGFKIRKKGALFYFDQYQEEETAESIQWIEEHNQLLQEIKV